jgi:5-hydroxyisourate hydrolase-like protein (transthyretin family)
MSKAGGISIHAVDVASGRPAHGLAVRLFRAEPQGNVEIASGICGETGLFDHPTARGAGIAEGRYVTEFDVGKYYGDRGVTISDPGFLETVHFHFGVADAAQHYHLPFKFTAWGFSLFRGGL